MDFVSKIGDRIRELREIRGMTQQSLAEALHVKRETINMWENGLRDLKTGAIIALADFFNVSSDYLLGLVDFKSVDADVQSICKKTGLSGNAVESLVEMQTQDVIYYDEVENEEKEPMFEDWAQRKEKVFEVVNLLLSWPILEDIIFLSEELHDRLRGQTIPIPAKNTSSLEVFEELKYEAQKRGMQDLLLHPLEYDDLKKYEVNERMRIIGDRLYRLLKYGTIWAPDGKLYHNDTEAFEQSMRGSKNDEA